ncbi:GntP family permease [Streptomyces sp. DSM 42041]|uniref:GntP family permease n=1 Tax=Streptomyces hazeniae TaxID=3075538 RepID=A0ABU2NV67_9ACTN|nr:GntP family permease [Streptomyces sp. DSM 42041]MDT0380870.1 GntP family permease [Streptomyces sp. DSM 42041]
MEAIEPVYGTATLLLIAAGAVALLLFLIMKVKLHAFVALVGVSVVTALAVGFPMADIPDVLMFGFADTIGSVAILVAFGVMLGRLLEVTGGAQVLADTLINRFGEKRAPLALGVAALLFGFPIFFDAGLVVFLPIILTVARRFGGSLLFYALPAAGAFAAMHAIVPPHPGPVAATEQLRGDIGVTLLVGIPVAVVAWYVGVYLVSRWLGKRVYVSVSDVVFGQVRDEHGRTAEQRAEAGENEGTRKGKGTAKSDGADEGKAGDAGAPAADAPTLGHRPPAFGTVLLLLLIPLVLISFDTVLDTLGAAGALDADSGFPAFLGLLGNTTVALLITVLAAILMLGRPRTSMAGVRGIVDEALGPICAIILITGAGGMFGGVLELSGIGDALSNSLSDLGISLILQAFIIATLLRVAQGSATVALTTTGGLIASAVNEANLGDFQIALLVVAIAAGATVLSHVNDSGFWLVSRFFGMDEKTTLKTWTVMETTLGLSAFVIALGLWAVF